MSAMKEKKVFGWHRKTDAISNETDPDYGCVITVQRDYDILVPRGLMDILTPGGPFWMEFVAVSCQEMWDGRLSLLDIYPSDEGKDEDAAVGDEGGYEPSRPDRSFASPEEVRRGRDERDPQSVSEMKELTVFGWLECIDAIGYESDPDYECCITIHREHDIMVPRDQMDLVALNGPFWGEFVVVLCREMSCGRLAMRGIGPAYQGTGRDTEAGRDTVVDGGDDFCAPQQSPPPLRPDGAECMSGFLLDIMQDRDADVGLYTHLFRAVSQSVDQQGYRRWEIVLNDGDVLEINPIPSSADDEPWLWAVALSEHDGRRLLVEGGAVISLWQACRDRLGS